jgi:hypothetical protein
VDLRDRVAGLEKAHENHSMGYIFIGVGRQQYYDGLRR